MKSNSRVYVIGHKNPDTDSICSAIAYADIKNRTDKTKTYVARRAGQINEETEYVLKRFGVRAPGYLPNAGTQVKEIEIHEVPSVPGTISVKKAYSMMKNNNVVTLPITSPDNDLQGVITVSDIAESYMDSYDSHVMSLARTQYRSIADTLDGSVIVGNEHGYFIRGKVVVGAFHPDTMENYIEKDDLVILGNRAEDQLCAIEMDASCIIVGLGAKVTKTIQKFAEEKCCVIISSPHDTYTIARLINQSIPVKYLMRRSNLITFSTEDFLDDIKEVMKNQRHRDFPILNKKGKYVGTISRRNLIGNAGKKLILVDHNEESQAVDNVKEAEILEIIDHHRLGSLETMAPRRSSCIRKTSRASISRSYTIPCRKTPATPRRRLSYIFTGSCALRSRPMRLRHATSSRSCSSRTSVTTWATLAVTASTRSWIWISTPLSAR